jgi:hypothetical protein
MSCSRFEPDTSKIQVWSIPTLWVNLLNGTCQPIEYFVSHCLLCFGMCLVGLKKSNLGSSWLKIPLTEITGSCVCVCNFAVVLTRSPLHCTGKVYCTYKYYVKCKMTWSLKGVFHGLVYPKKYSAKVNKARTIMSTDRETKYQWID